MVWPVKRTPINKMRCADNSTFTTQDYPKKGALRRGVCTPPMCNAECVDWPSARRLTCLRQARTVAKIPLIYCYLELLSEDCSQSSQRNVTLRRYLIMWAT